MKKIMLSLCVVVLISGCLNSPPSPKSHEVKYEFQCFYLTLPETVLDEVIGPLTLLFLEDSLPGQILASQSEVDEILRISDATLLDLSVRAGVGESVTNDQTKATSLPIDFSIVDGEVVGEYETYKMGQSFAVFFNKINNNNVTCQIHYLTQVLRGFDEYVVGDGIKKKMPFTEKREINTKATLETGVWIVLGGLADQQPDGTPLNSLFCIRVLPSVID